MTRRFGNLNFYKLPWRDLPGVLPEDTEVFVVGDVHGQADLLEAALSEIAATPRDAKARHLVFLGDLIDRGPNSIATVDLAMNGNKDANVDHLHVLPGNHDLMLLDALTEEIHLRHWLVNGGKSVLIELERSQPGTPWSEIVATVRSKLHPGYLEKIASGPTYLQLGDLIFVHAGIDPFADQAAFLMQSRRQVRSDMHWATIRYPFLDWTEGWDKNALEPDRHQRKPTVVVHGHTPALRQALTDAGDLVICDGIDDYRTVDLDIGAGHRAQLAWAHFKMSDGQCQMRIFAVAEPKVEPLLGAVLNPNLTR